MPEANWQGRLVYVMPISMVTDFDCWHPQHDSVTVDQIVTTMNQNSNNAFKLIENFQK